MITENTTNWVKSADVKKSIILNGVRLKKKGLLTENNGTIINAQLLMIMEKFNFLKNFKKLLMGGHDEKLKNFGKSNKK